MNTDQASLNSFEKDGFLLLEDIELNAQVKSLRNSILELMCYRAKSLGLYVNNKDITLDSIYNCLAKKSPKITGGIYDAIRELPEFYDLINTKSIKNFVKHFFNWQKIHLPFGLCQFRIDRPGDYKYFFDWHQDYTFNLLSTSAVTFWVPLTDVTTETGALRLLPGSHNQLHPVTGSREYKPGENGKAASHLTFRLHDPDIKSFEDNSITVQVKAGQFLMFHSHLLHRSGFNNSQSMNRWTAIFRMGDFFDHALLARDFYCARPNKPSTMAGFSTIYPHLFID